MEFNSPNTKLIKSICDNWLKLKKENITRPDLPQLSFGELELHATLFMSYVEILKGVQWDLVPNSVSDQIVSHFKNTANAVNAIASFQPFSDTGNQSIHTTKQQYSANFQGNLSSLHNGISQLVLFWQMQDGQISRLSTALINALNEVDVFKTNASLAIEAMAKQGQESIKKLQQECNGIRAAFLEQETIKQATAHLEANIASAKRATKIYSFIIAIIVITIAVIAGLIAPGIPDKFADVKPSNYLALMTLALAGLWPLRIAIKLLMSNVHLKIDSTERLVLLRTYLSMMANERLISSADRGAIFGAVFRTPATGIVADDYSPPVPAAIVSRFLESETPTGRP